MQMLTSVLNLEEEVKSRDIKSRERTTVVEVLYCTSHADRHQGKVAYCYPSSFEWQEYDSVISECKLIVITAVETSCFCIGTR